MTDDHTTETWISAGARVGASGKRVNEWITPPDGTAVWFATRTSYPVGSAYEVQISRSSERVTMHGDPVFTGSPDHDDPRVAEWEIKTERVERQFRREAAERKAKARPGVLDEACAALCEIAVRTKSFEDLEALAASVRQRLIAAWDKS